MKYPHVDAAKKYAEDVISGRIDVCRWVKLACKRQLKDLKKYKKTGKKYHFSEKKAERICNFIELLPHIKGEWARRKELIKLEPWQSFIYTTVFGWMKKDENRRFRTVYIEVPRKNSKSTMSSGAGLFMLTADNEPGSEVYSAATTRDQARIVFDTSQKMARQEKDLRERFGVQVNAHNINVIETASKFEPLSAEGNSLDGLNVHCGIIDELHAHKTRQVFDVIETGTGARIQSLLWLITTAGSDRSGICYEQRTYLTKILENITEDDTYFGIIYTIDDGDEWTDPKIWAKANPNYNVSVYPDDIARLCKKATQMPSAQNNFLTKRLNIWVNADTAWMNMLSWDKCADHSLKIEAFEKKPCIIGVDLASKVDMAVMAQLFHENGHYHAFLHYYLPEETAENNTNSQYSGWSRQGLLTLTPGAVIDFTYIEDDLRDLSKRFAVKEIPYDPFQATEFSTRMANEGFPMIEMRPTVLNFSEPMKQLEALVLDSKFHFNGDPILTWMISNVVCHLDNKDNIYPRKERQENKIDGVVATLMALNRWLANQPKESIYEKRGLLVI
ncbi:MAG: terminase large subunit [Spirochaetes bacterium]|nr:terminase large subunit [Spirochaetota bacterium]